MMDMHASETPRTPNPRRRQRTKLQIFKEAYLPTIILAVTIVLIIVFIIGAAVSGKDPEQTEPSGTGSTPAPSPSTTEPTQSTASFLLQQEADQRVAQAAILALEYDYDGALSVLSGFSGDMAQYPELQQAYQYYTSVKDNMVAWNACDVVNLSFHLLIADPARAYADDVYASQYKRNFVTVTEFSAILQQLYDNGYVLVGLDDFYSQEYNTSSGRYVFTESALLLPEGKTPIMLTETNVNYYTYMTDSNGDGKPDAGADGFACRLCHDANGFYNELVNADGSISTGAYDMVPILENFIAENPDFSYKGARAVIAFSGYDGILGYRINSTKLSADALQTERDGAVAIVEALKAAGYDLGCYSYNNISYGSDKNAAKVQSDIQKWLDEITPVIGALDIMVFAQNSDIAGTESYSGNSKFNVLYNAGFTHYIGVSTSAWNQVEDQYVRHSRINVSGYYLLNYPELFDGMFDVATILEQDISRN